MGQKPYSVEDILAELIGRKITRADVDGGMVYLTLDDEEVFGVSGNRLSIGFVDISQEFLH